VTVRAGIAIIGVVLALAGCASAPGGAAGGGSGPVSDLESGNGNLWTVLDGCAPVEQVAQTAGFDDLVLAEGVLLTQCLYANEATGDTVTVGFRPGITPASDQLAENYEGMTETSTPTLGIDAKVGIATANCVISVPANTSDGTFGTFRVVLFNVAGTGGAQYCDPLLPVLQLFAAQDPDDPSAPTGEPTCEEAAAVWNSPEADTAIEIFAGDYFDGDIDAAFDFIDTCKF